MEKPSQVPYGVLQDEEEPSAPPPYQPPGPSAQVGMVATSPTVGQQPVNQTTIFPVEPVITAQPRPVVYGECPVLCICPYCQHQVVSLVRREPGCATISWVICLFLFFGIFGLIPLCTESCHDAIHTCPVCRGVIGTYKQC